MTLPILDPQIQAILDESVATVPVTEIPVAQARSEYEALCKEQWGELDEMHAIENLEADGIPIRVYRPSDKARSMALIYFHGGGWVVGSLDSHDGPCRAFAKTADIVVISVGYRLAPEHPFPAPLEDAWSATQWIYNNAFDLNIDAERIGVGGDSAGATLATVVAGRGRDHQVPLALQLLLYPVIDHRCNTSSYSLFSQGYGLTRDAMRWYWQQYLGGAETTNPEASPSLAENVQGLPRAIVVTAEADILRDEAEGYAQRMFLSTVETEGYRYDGMIHGFLRMAGKVDRSRTAYDELAESIKAMLGKGGR
jgi:acetyl esterase